MEEKKSHKADLEHLRPWMFLAGIVLTLLAFVIILEVQIIAKSVKWDGFEEDIAMDLDIKPNDERDLIAASEKRQLEEPHEALKINKVDNLADLPPEITEATKEEEKEAVDEEEQEQEDPINLNEEDPEILRIVQELPEYPGGMVEFMKWLTKTLHYPTDALRKKVEGKVMVSFIVEKDGSLSNIKVEQPVNPLLDSEALRVARLMPNWKPGKDHGKICRTKIAIPIIFEI